MTFTLFMRAALAGATMGLIVMSATPAAAMQICSMLFNHLPGDQCRMADGRVCTVQAYGSSETHVEIRCTRKVQPRKRRVKRRRKKRK